MMHTREMKDSEGTFGEWKRTALACVRCDGGRVMCRKWESDCGGYTDLQIRCHVCGRTWWIEGPDS